MRFFLLSCILLRSITFVTALWPLPRHFEYGSASVWLSPNVQLSISNVTSGAWNIPNIWTRVQQILPGSRNNASDLEPSLHGAEVLRAAFERTKHSIFHCRFIPSKFHPRNAEFEPLFDGEKQTVNLVTLKLINPVEFSHGTDLPITEESYRLKISEDGSVFITTSSVVGGLHALQTFAQLFYASSHSAIESYTPFAPVNIVDGPAFKHRGLNLDISRNWIRPSDVLRVLDAMACNKLNRLHIHATDAQSWPLEIPSLPDLAREGAYDNEKIWSVDDLRQVQRHGQLRGIEVYLEIDVPGHTTSIASSRPELIAGRQREPWPVFAEEPPSGQLKLNSTGVYKFLTTLLEDILPRNAEAAHHFHFGGDEVNTNVYGLDSAINATSKAILRPFLQKLMDHVFALTEHHSLTPIVWEEILLEWNLVLPESTIIQTWRSNEALTHVLSKGHQVLFGSSTHWYLDCGHGAWLDPANPHKPSSDSRVNPPYLDHCQPYKNWRHVYSYNPLDGLPDEQKHLILGGEVHLWGEMTDHVTMDGMLWPRAAAAAEVLWRGPGTPVSEDTTRRLAMMRERLLLIGVAAGMVQMEWCLRNIGGCTL